MEFFRRPERWARPSARFLPRKYRSFLSPPLSISLSLRMSRGSDRSVHEIWPAPSAAGHIDGRPLSYFLARIVALPRSQRETLVDVEWLFTGDDRTRERDMFPTARTRAANRRKPGRIAANLRARRSDGQTDRSPCFSLSTSRV